MWRYKKEEQFTLPASLTPFRKPSSFSAFMFFFVLTFLGGGHPYPHHLSITPSLPLLTPITTPGTSHSCRLLLKHRPSLTEGGAKRREEEEGRAALRPRLARESGEERGRRGGRRGHTVTPGNQRELTITPGTASCWNRMGG